MISKNEIRTFSEANRVLVRGEDFIYLLPNPGLRDWISNYTITFPNKNIISEKYTVIPHGSATLVFSCNGKGIYGNLFGPATKPCIVGEQANQSDVLFIIEFQPAGLSALTGINQRELTDKVIPFELINPVINKKISETLDNVRSLYELISNLDRILLSNLNIAYPSELKLVIRKIIENAGNILTKELSDSVFYSERQINRILDRYLGMGAKSFSRLVRINRAARLLRNPKNSITNACNLSNFYDLSHFIRDFKSICGVTPLEYCNNMSDFYSEIAKF